MKSIVFLITILVLSLLMTHCSNYRELSNQTEVLFRKDWKLTEVQGQEVPDSVKSRFQFSPGTISGTTGCNQLSANFVPGKKQTIKFTPEVLTNKTCPDENATALETKFLDALSKSTKWSMTGGGLVLGNGETTLIKFTLLQ